MDRSSSQESVSTERLLRSLTIAIEEARLVRSIIESKDVAERLKAETPVSKRLAHVNREIEYLESQLAQLRSRAHRA